MDNYGKSGCLMVSTLDSGLSGLDFEPWLGTLCCVLGQDTTLTAPLSSQVHKWVLTNLILGLTLSWTSIPSKGGGGLKIFLVTSYHTNWDKLQHNGPLGLYADFFMGNAGLRTGYGRAISQYLHLAKVWFPTGRGERGGVQVTWFIQGSVFVLPDMPHPPRVFSFKSCSEFIP